MMTLAPLGLACGRWLGIRLPDSVPVKALGMVPAAAAIALSGFGLRQTLATHCGRAA